MFDEAAYAMPTPVMIRATHAIKYEGAIADRAVPRKAEAPPNPTATLRPKWSKMYPATKP